MFSTPKTNWEIKPRVNGLYNGDWLNCGDMNRISGNLQYLRFVGQTLYGVAIPFAAMRTFSAAEFIYATDMQAVEDNLYGIVSRTYTPQSYGGKKTWAPNGPTPTVDDLNRIEGSIAELYAHFIATGTRANYVTQDGDTLLTSDNKIYKVWEVA